MPLIIVPFSSKIKDRRKNMSDQQITVTAGERQ